MIKKLIKVGEIYWINFDPTIGTEINKIRLALIIFVSVNRVIALPITSNVQLTNSWQLVIKGLVKEKDGKILFDQIRSFDKQRLFRKIGVIKEIEIIKQILRKMLSL